MYDLVQILGSLLVLSAFVLTLLGRLRQDGRAYLVLNVVGSGVLAAIAVIGREWGFLLLEGVWAIASLMTLARTTRRMRTYVRAAGRAHPAR